MNGWDCFAGSGAKVFGMSSVRSTLLECILKQSARLRSDISYMAVSAIRVESLVRQIILCSRDFLVGSFYLDLPLNRLLFIQLLNIW